MAGMFSIDKLTEMAGKIVERAKTIDPAAVANAAVNAVRLTVPTDEIYDNGVALTPPMGWSSWNTFRSRISEQVILETAEAMKNSGLADCGYEYINIDDCWQSSMRDSEGRLQSDPVTFPSGIKALSEKVNSLGLKLGIYSSNGTLTCEDLPGSLGYEETDAETFAQWGVEYFKYDFGHNVHIPFRAPGIEKITVSRAGVPEQEFSCDDAFLTGSARVVEDIRIPGFRYISGLSGNAGTAIFDGITADEAGEYVLTLCVRKKSSKKYCEIRVNDSRTYIASIPPTLNSYGSGRYQVMIHLDEGSNKIEIYNPVASAQDSAALQFTKMGKCLKNAAEKYAEENSTEVKPIVYSVCEWGSNLPWKWGTSACNLWRTTPDIKPSWASILAVYEFNVHLAQYASPGHWNDPDMLEVGNGDLTYEENKSHFTLWCMMAAPLILGNDIRKYILEDGTADSDDMIFKIISDKDVIAIDQDPLGVQCRRVLTTGVEDVLIKPLEGNRVAVCFFNKTGTQHFISCEMNKITLHPSVNIGQSSSYELTDVWAKSTETVSGDKLTVSVNGHGVRLFILKAV